MIPRRRWRGDVSQRTRVASSMAGETSSGGGVADQRARFRERARKARVIAARYRGEAASVLIEIADECDARAADLESQSD